MPTSTRQTESFFPEIPGEFDGTQRGDVGIAPYAKRKTSMYAIAPTQI